MNKKHENIPKIDWENIKPIEFERVLNLYGMKKVTYCTLCGKSKSWWYNVLIKRRFLTYSDVEILTNNIGIDVINTLLAKVRKQYPPQ